MILLDSSLLIAFHNAADSNHEKARRVLDRIGRNEFGPALLLEYVFLEVVTVLAARRGLPMALAAAKALRDAKEVEFVPCSPYFSHALDVFQNQPKAGWSFVDAAMVAIARRRDAKHIATFDRDFEKVADLRVVSS